MSESTKLLQAEIAADEQAIARLYELLAKVWDTLESPEQTISEQRIKSGDSDGAAAF